ncbi:MAG: ATP-binding protein [Pseudomonadota bacterium]
MEDRFNAWKVETDKLRWTCDPDSLGVAGTAEVNQLEEKVIAQERAVSALRFGMSMPENDYNIFVSGQPRTGLTYLTRTFLKEAAKSESPPLDWCYVFNFRDPDRPKAISLPRGLARELARDMTELLADLRGDIPEVFESDEYRQRREEIIKKFTLARNEALGGLEKIVNQNGFILNMSQVGMMVVPAHEDKPMTEEDLEKLSEEEKGELRRRSELLQEEMNQTALRIRVMEREAKTKQKELESRMALHRIGHLIDELQEKYEKFRAVLTYLVEVKNDVIRNLDEFRPKEQPQAPFPLPQVEPDFTRYQVNVLIDNSEAEGAPVIYEINPTYNNLFGALERKASFGTVFTDFTMIRPGSIHRANGGYLVIQARDLLKWGLSWEALKRAIKNKEIIIEDPGEMMGIISTKNIKPEPIPLKIKIILIGEPYLYQMLHEYDDQFKLLFKVQAQLDDQVERHPDEQKMYISFVARMVKQRGLRHVDKTGLARILEYGVEVAGRRKKLTLKMALVRDILREADYWAAQDAAPMISGRHVETAIRRKNLRSALPEEKMREFVLDGYVNISTTGTRVGQVNGLSVYDFGDHSFGLPARITASISVGRQGVVNIDREAKLSGNFHTKGLLIMQGRLRAQYAQDYPLSLSASLVFEQSYSMVDGDSASAAEMFALLSGISGVPLKQSLAVTGAISQQGEIQPIGGVNQKIEGFFDLCLARGLTGDQGVIIPAANLPDLMLKNEVVDAARQGLFSIHAVRTADEALEILTDRPAGSRGDDGVFPEGSFNRLVEDRLKSLAEKARVHLKDEAGDGRKDEPSCSSCGAARV